MGGGTSAIGGDSGYSGMASAMGDGSEFATPDGRATGGPVRAGQIYRWQEQGMEMFSPQSDGTVINANQVKAMAGGGSRSAMVNVGGITINAAPGMSPQAIAREVTRQLQQAVRGAGMDLHDGGSYV
jgi:hypothetical protein